jgi:hypothetical protein
MDGKVDFHIHTTYSDGALSPVDVVHQASRAGLSIISITDHDHTGALEEAAAEGQRRSIEVVPGVELSASVDEQDVHILGYFIDPANSRLQEYLSHFRQERIRRAERIVGKLNALNVPLPFDAVLDQAGSGSVGRPHIANALVEQGFIETYHEAFYRYIGAGRPAYEKKFQISPREAVELISSAGGLSFIAHPGTLIAEDLLLRLINDGVDGIETVHPSHSAERTAYYSGIASEYFLLMSGGSDFHGGRKNGVDLFGKYVIPESYVAMMRRRLV